MRRDFNDQPLPENASESINSAIYNGRKIDAIKLYRQISGKSLKEAKDFVEDLEDELRVSDPTRLVTGPRGNGCGVGVLAHAAMIAAAAKLLGQL